MFNSYNIFDSSNELKPIKKTLATHEIMPRAHHLSYELSMHHLTLKDIIYDPFMQKEMRPYLSLRKTESTLSERREFKIDFRLSEFLFVEKRVRYNFWMLLGDVGGFNSAMLLIAAALTVFHEEVAFQSDYLGKVFFDQE